MGNRYLVSYTCTPTPNLEPLPTHMLLLNKIFFVNPDKTVVKIFGLKSVLMDKQKDFRQVT